MVSLRPAHTFVSNSFIKFSLNYPNLYVLCVSCWALTDEPCDSLFKQNCMQKPSRGNTKAELLHPCNMHLFGVHTWPARPVAVRGRGLLLWTDQLSPRPLWWSNYPWLPVLCYVRRPTGISEELKHSSRHVSPVSTMLSLLLYLYPKHPHSPSPNMVQRNLDVSYSEGVIKQWFVGNSPQAGC